MLSVSGMWVLSGKVTLSLKYRMDAMDSTPQMLSPVIMAVVE